MPAGLAEYRHTMPDSLSTVSVNIATDTAGSDDDRDELDAPAPGHRGRRLCAGIRYGGEQEMNGGQIEATHNALVVLRTEVDALTKQNAELLAALECINVYVEEWGIKPGYTTSMYMVLIQDTARAAIKAAEPVKATSGFLNQRLRTEAQAKADRDA